MASIPLGQEAQLPSPGVEEQRPLLDRTGTGQFTAGMLSPQSSLKSHLSSLHLNSLFASSCMPAGSLSICIFWVPRMVSLTFAKQGLSLFCCSELGAATTVAVTGAFYQGLQPLGPVVCSVLWWFRLWVQRVLCSVRWVLQQSLPGPDHCIVWCELCSLLPKTHPDPAKGLWEKVQETGTGCPCILKPALPSVYFIPLGSLASFRIILFQNPWNGNLSSLILLGLPALLLGSHMFLYFQSPTCDF